MSDLIPWINENLAADELPIPLIAGLAHYQYATVHPYYDGNGRTARLMTTLILHKNGYGLKGIYSLEEYYARNLSAYYDALNVGESHNYYMGRVDADVTEFLAYFCRGMAEAFAARRFKQPAAGQQTKAHFFANSIPVSARSWPCFKHKAPRPPLKLHRNLVLVHEP